MLGGCPASRAAMGTVIPHPLPWDLLPLGLGRCCPTPRAAHHRELLDPTRLLAGVL